MSRWSLRLTVVLLASLFVLAKATRLGWQTKVPQEPTETEELRESRFSQAIIQGLAMILVSEMGDETFIIAAILAMKHPRTVVFLGALSALALMTVVSAFLGVLVPALISPEVTHHAATVLYFFFGSRLLYIAHRSASDHAEEDIREVEGKLAERRPTTGFWRRQLLKICTPVLLETSILTFVAEWGDRSQIATITLASHLDPVGVSIGAVVGHSVCTGLAVVGGQLIAMKISQRTAALCGSCLFFVFAVHNALWG